MVDSIIHYFKSLEKLNYKIKKATTNSEIACLRRLACLDDYLNKEFDMAKINRSLVFLSFNFSLFLVG